MLRNAIGIIFFAMSVTACGDFVDDTPQASTPRFQVGPPITDPAVASVVFFEGHADTLASDDFSRNLIRLHSMFPDVMSDPVQESSIRREIVKQFVVERLLVGEAQRSDIEIDSSDIARRLEEFRASFASDEDFTDEMEKLGQTDSDLVDQFRIELTRNAITEFVKKKTPEPSTTEVEEFRMLLSEKILAQHILFMMDETMTKQERSELKEKALAVLDSARSAVNFGDLARRHSDDVGTAQVGGELPWFRRGEMVQSFEDAAFALSAPSDVTENLVVTTYGYHVIRLISREKDEPVSIDSARVLLWRRQIRQAERDLIDGLQEKAEVRINPDLVPGI